MLSRVVEDKERFGEDEGATHGTRERRDRETSRILPGEDAGSLRSLPGTGGDQPGGGPAGKAGLPADQR